VVFGLHRWLAIKQFHKEHQEVLDFLGYLIFVVLFSLAVNANSHGEDFQVFLCLPLCISCSRSIIRLLVLLYGVFPLHFTDLNGKFPWNSDTMWQ